MFVLSFSKKQIRLGVLVAVILALLIAFLCVTHKNVKTGKENALNLRAATQEERIAYLSQFGYEVAPDPVEVQEIIIPEAFNDTYEVYNGIQKKQGFDLLPYAGKRVKKWSYRILNYPGEENAEYILATLLIFDGQVIGGDVCSTELEGFMHGFVRENAEQSPTT